MQSRIANLVPCAWVALAVLGALPAAALEEVSGTPPAIRLLAPDAGTALVAGGTAELAWEPLPSFAALDEVEEWEAFLSLDGGRTYPFRLTPHLDQDVRRFRWRVPPVPTEDARLLFRFGDERRETAVAMAQRFVIAAPDVPAPLGDEGVAFRRVSPRLAGEPALPGQRGVVAWVEGSRRGTALREVVGQQLATLAPAQALPDSPLATDIEGAEEAPLEATAARMPTSEVPRPARDGHAFLHVPPRPRGDLLLLTQRRNE
ncbi:MAG TPA: hypothetical protein VFS60_01210 [Thermoanaerobaculia bacterium]|nr:hypothetical protein [Thermoanaerobaculia bacterium]